MVDNLRPANPHDEDHDCLVAELHCPRCGGRWRWVTEDHPRALTVRERRVVMRCVRPGCGWEGAFVGELMDLGIPRDLPRRRAG